MDAQVASMRRRRCAGGDAVHSLKRPLVLCIVCANINKGSGDKYHFLMGERGGSVVECRTPEREVRGSRPTAAVLCP